MASEVGKSNKRVLKSIISERNGWEKRIGWLSLISWIFLAKSLKFAVDVASENVSTSEFALWLSSETRTFMI